MRKSSKRKFKDNELVRFFDDNDVFYTIIDFNEKQNTYSARNKLGEVFVDLDEEKIKGEHDFFKGDKIIYNKFPFKSQSPFVVKDIMNDGTYLIENEQSTHTNISGKSLILQKT